MRRADDEADAREAAPADVLLSPLARELRDAVPQQLAVPHDHVLHVRRAFVRRFRDDEEPGAVPLARGEERLDGLAAEIRVERDRVGERWIGLAGLDIS